MPAFGAVCENCRQRNHFTEMCNQPCRAQAEAKVHQLGEGDSDDSDKSIYILSTQEKSQYFT